MYLCRKGMWELEGNQNYFRIPYHNFPFWAPFVFPFVLGCEKPHIYCGTRGRKFFHCSASKTISKSLVRMPLSLGVIIPDKPRQWEWGCPWQMGLSVAPSWILGARTQTNPIGISWPSLPSSRHHCQGRAGIFPALAAELPQGGFYGAALGPTPPQSSALLSGLNGFGAVAVLCASCHPYQERSVSIFRRRC